MVRPEPLEGEDERPRTPAQLVRCILESLAETYRDELHAACRLARMPLPERLHVVGGRVILQLDPQSPLAGVLLREGRPLRVRDGSGATVLEGVLDSDGECEGPWPFAQAPAPHFQRHGARFTVEPAGT